VCDNREFDNSECELGVRVCVNRECVITEGVVVCRHPH